MSLRALDDAIDRLYRLPLATFVAERRALAKRFPEHASAIGSLPKPTLPAWAINQVFWTERRRIDGLVRASEQVRRLQMRRLAGSPADLTAAVTARQAALARVLQAAEGVLAKSGEPASGATLDRVLETLETLPWTVLNGRLARPLKPTGLEGLAMLAAGPSKPASTPAAVVPFRPGAGPAPSPHQVAAGARAQARAELTAVARELRRATLAERRAVISAQLAAAAVRRAQAQRERATQALEQAAQMLEERHRDARQADQARERAGRTRAALETQLTAMRSRR